MPGVTALFRYFRLVKSILRNKPDTNKPGHWWGESWSLGYLLVPQALTVTHALLTLIRRSRSAYQLARLRREG